VCLCSKSYSAGNRSHIDDAAMTMFAHAGYHGFDAAQPTEKIGFHGLGKTPIGTS